MSCGGGFPIHTLDYDNYRDDRTFTCAMVGLAVVFVYLTLTRPASPMFHPGVHKSCNQLTAMVATAGSLVSARVGDVLGGGDNLMKASASKTTTGVPSSTRVMLVDAKGSKGSKDAWQSIGEGEKAKCEQTARAFLASHPKCVVMIYAPWCPHCHSAMAGFSAAAASAPSDVSFLMINAEALPVTAFQGDKALYNLQYFPTFAASTGAHGALQEATDVAAAAQALVSSAAATPAEEPAAAMFAHLF